MSDAELGLALIAVLLGLPLLIGIAGWLRPRSEAREPAELPGRHSISLSLLTYALAFNITFFIQELFLVVPKALTPGLQPTLYHNNHGWEGSHSLEALFQGTGALAILLSGLLFAWLAKRGAGRTEAVRLFVLWMAYHGLFQSLPQVAFAAANPGSDTGQALDYFALSRTAEWAIGVVAALAIAAAGLFMARRFLELHAPADARICAGFIFRIAVIPAALAIPILILFRVPREWIEVVAPIIAVPLVGLSWMQAASWWTRAERPVPTAQASGLLLPLVLLLLLLAIFQLVLRPGIAFY